MAKKMERDFATVAKRKPKQATQQQQQPYDNTLKSLIEHHEHEIIPLFLKGAKFVKVLNIEVLRTPLRVDRVYKVRYRGKYYVLHLEFESGADKQMALRLLSYHTYFLAEYGLPVISIIVYPFPVSIAESPFREMDGDEEILTFHFRTLCLWKLEAEYYLKEHLVSMYALLPTMHGANAELLLQALKELTKRYKGQETELANQLKWLGVLLRRAETMPIQDQREIQEQLDMWNNLLEEDEHLQKIIARAVEKRTEKFVEEHGEKLAEERAEKLVEERAEKLAEERAEKLVEERAEKFVEERAEKLVEQRLAEAEARVRVELAEAEARVRTEGEVQASQTILIDIVQMRFPTLVELAQQRATQTKQPDALREVIRLISTAPDEAAARWVLSLKPAA